MTTLTGFSVFAILVAGVGAFLGAPAWLMAACLITFLTAIPAFAIGRIVHDTIRSPLREERP